MVRHAAVLVGQAIARLIERAALAAGGARIELGTQRGKLALAQQLDAGCDQVLGARVASLAHLLLYGWLPSGIKIWAYRAFRGYKIGEGVKLGFHANGAEIDPDLAERPIDTAALDDLRRYAETWVPGVVGSGDPA